MLFDIVTLTDWDSPKWKDYIDLLMDKWDFTFLGEGCTRRTFLSPDKKYVLKFPTFEGGVTANRIEHEIYRKYMSGDEDGVQYAPCRLIQKTVLLMRACKEIYGDSQGCEDASSIIDWIPEGEGRPYPDWAESIDCGQVGMLPNGKVVAYDYG